MSEIYWSQFRNNPQHTGRSAVPSFRNPTLRWEKAITTDNSFFEEILIGRDGTLYIPTEKGCEAFDSATGYRKWVSPIVDSCRGLAVSIQDNKIHLLDSRGLYSILDATNGQKILSFKTHAFQSNYQTIAPSGTAYFWGDLTKLYALTQDEKPRLIFETSSPIIDESYAKSVSPTVVSPAVGIDNTLYFGTLNGRIYAVASDGKEKWNIDIATPIQEAPAIGSDGTIYFSSASEHRDKLFAFTPAGKLKWTFNSKIGYSSRLAIGLDDTIYFSTFDGTVYAISSDGNQKWTFSTYPIYSGISLSADEVIYFSSTDGHIYALQEDGSLLWKIDLDDGLSTSPTIGPDGTLYVLGSNVIYAVGTKL